MEEEEEEFITSGNWRGKHNSLEEGQRFRQQGEFKHAEDIILATLQFLKLQMATTMNMSARYAYTDSTMKTEH